MAQSKIVFNGIEYPFGFGPAGPDGNPIGTIISFMGLKPPKDYLICDGSIYKISDYPNLAVFFKGQFGSETYFGSNGDGTFAVPDMRNLFLRGYHGEADEKLSDEIGKIQDATEHPMAGFDSQYNARYIGIRDGEIYSGPKKQDKRGPKGSRGRQDLNFVEYTTTPPEVWYTSRPVNMAVLYCIKAVKSESEKRDDGEIYSTEETRIGTWIDGKPLYRTIIEKTVNLTLSQSYTVASLPNKTSRFYTKIFSLCRNESDHTYVLPVVTDSGTVRWSIGDNGISILSGRGDFLKNMRLTIILEYTKTTDTVTQSVRSEVLPKTSGTISRDGKQYDYELPDGVLSSGSSATIFDGSGSSAKDIL